MAGCTKRKGMCILREKKTEELGEARGRDRSIATTYSVICPSIFSRLTVTSCASLSYSGEPIAVAVNPVS